MYSIQRNGEEFPNIFCGRVIQSGCRMNSKYRVQSNYTVGVDRIEVANPDKLCESTFGVYY